MNKDFKEAFLERLDKIQYLTKEQKNSLVEWAYTYLQKEGGKDVAGEKLLFDVSYTYCWGPHGGKESYLAKDQKDALTQFWEGKNKEAFEVHSVCERPNKELPTLEPEQGEEEIKQKILTVLENCTEWADGFMEFDYKEAVGHLYQLFKKISHE